MKITRNSLLILAAAATVLFGSCSKDGETPKLPDYEEIKINTTNIGVGQLISASCKPIGTDTLNINYTWYLPSGEIIGKQTSSCNFKPRCKGQTPLTVTIARGKNNITKTILIDVLECDFEYGMWGNKTSDIILNEQINGSTSPLISTLADGKTLLTYTRSNVSVTYITTSSFLIGGTRTTTSKHYDPIDYIREYDYELSRLTSLYGYAFSQEKKWKKIPERSGYNEYKEIWGEEIAKGNLEIITTFKTARTSIESSCKLQSNKNVCTTSIFRKDILGSNNTSSVRHQ